MKKYSKHERLFIEILCNQSIKFGILETPVFIDECLKSIYTKEMLGLKHQYQNNSHKLIVFSSQEYKDKAYYYCLSIFFFLKYLEKNNLISIEKKSNTGKLRDDINMGNTQSERCKEIIIDERNEANKDLWESLYSYIYVTPILHEIRANGFVTIEERNSNRNFKIARYSLFITFFIGILSCLIQLKEKGYHTEYNAIIEQLQQLNEKDININNKQKQDTIFIPIKTEYIKHFFIDNTCIHNREY